MTRAAALALGYAVPAMMACLLAGCGASPLHTAVARYTSAARTMSAGAMTVTQAQENDGKSPSPGHLLPESEDFTITGTDADGKFTLKLHAVNPGGTLYVPTPQTVTLDGSTVPASQYNGLGKRLGAAKASKQDQTAVMRAGSILELAR